jgi:rhodanese-related sulfurtransferase
MQTRDLTLGWRHPTRQENAMPEQQNSDARRRRRRGRGRPPGQPGSQHSSSSSSNPQQDKPQGFVNRFLSIVSFGLLGKAKPAPRRAPAPPVRFEGMTPKENRRDRGDRPERSEKTDRGDRGDRPQREARPPREPRPLQPPGEVTTERLYVGNLSYDATESDLFDLFNGVGKVTNAEVVVNSRTQRSKGFAFITMVGVEEAKRAVNELHGKEFMGRQLQISGAKPPQHDREQRVGDESVVISKTPDGWSIGRFFSFGQWPRINELCLPMKFSVALILAVMLSSCREAPSPGPSGPPAIILPAHYAWLSPDEAERLIQTSPDLGVLDVRDYEERADGRGWITGSIQIAWFTQQPKFAELDKEKPWLIYCEIGGRSELSAGMMADLGFKKVYLLRGGFVQWTTAGKAVAH